MTLMVTSISSFLSLPGLPRELRLYMMGSRPVLQECATFPWLSLSATKPERQVRCLFVYLPYTWLALWCDVTLLLPFELAAMQMNFSRTETVSSYMSQF